MGLKLDELRRRPAIRRPVNARFDPAGTAGPIDLHAVLRLPLALGAYLHEPQNPNHAPTLPTDQRRNNAFLARAPQLCGSPPSAAVGWQWQPADASRGDRPAWPAARAHLPSPVHRRHRFAVATTSCRDIAHAAHCSLLCPDCSTSVQGGRKEQDDAGVALCAGSTRCRADQRAGRGADRAGTSGRTFAFSRPFIRPNGFHRSAVSVATAGVGTKALSR
jgi:hypothetical protein